MKMTTKRAHELAALALFLAVGSGQIADDNFDAALEKLTEIYDIDAILARESETSEDFLAREGGTIT